MTPAELLEKLGTTNTSRRFAEYYDIPQFVADYMFDRAWCFNNIRHTFTSKGIGGWIRGGLDRDVYAISLQLTATDLVREMILAARTPK